MLISQTNTSITTTSFLKQVQSPVPVFEHSRVDFLKRLSIKIYQRFTDIDSKSLSFFIKQSLRVRSKESDLYTFSGLGLVFHLGPGNVPLNAIYSWFCGFLAGNQNIVRISSRATNNEIELVKFISNEIDKHGFQDYFLIGFDPNQFIEISETLADARILWGSNQTIDRIDNSRRNSCKDIKFGTKISCSILDLDKIKLYSDRQKLIIKNFLITDMFTKNSQPCTSPSTIFLISKSEKWYDIFSSILPYEDDPKLSIAEWDINLSAEQINRIQDLTFNYEPNSIIHNKQIHSFFVKTNKMIPSELNLRIFGICLCKSLEEVSNKIITNIQTITYGGISTNKILAESSLVDKSLRIVPIGQAHMFDTIWDGVDLLRSLSI